MCARLSSESQKRQSSVMSKKYIFGQGEMPEWVSGRLYHYRRPDGRTGYEIDTGRYMKVVFPGDVITLDSGVITVKRGVTVGEMEQDRG